MQSRKDRIKIWVINGPNLNFLGIRQPEVYGKESYDKLCLQLENLGSELGVEVACFQSNHEGVLIDQIQQAYHQRIDGIIINPGAYTHTSIALLDALLSVQIPTVEVHLSDIEQREDFRKISYIREACIHIEMGEGIKSYEKAFRWLAKYLIKT